MSTTIAAKIRSTAGQAGNDAVMTFATEHAVTTGEVAFLTARILVLHRGLAAFDLIGRSSVVEITKKTNDLAASSTPSAFSYTEYVNQVALFNADPEVSAFFTGGGMLPGATGQDVTGQELYLPIGTSIMVTEAGSAFKGRSYIPYAGVGCLNVPSGKVLPDKVAVCRAIYRWFHQLTDASAAEGNQFLTGTYSRKNNTFTRTTAVAVKDQFSNLASRRR
jgi:hypothetical protein